MTEDYYETDDGFRYRTKRKATRKDDPPFKHPPPKDESKHSARSSGKHPLSSFKYIPKKDFNDSNSYRNLCNLLEDIIDSIKIEISGIYSEGSGILKDFMGIVAKKCRSCIDKFKKEMDQTREKDRLRNEKLAAKRNDDLYETIEKRLMISLINARNRMYKTLFHKICEDIKGFSFKKFDSVIPQTQHADIVKEFVDEGNVTDAFSRLQCYAEIIHNKITRNKEQMKELFREERYRYGPIFSSNSKHLIKHLLNN